MTRLRSHVRQLVELGPLPASEAADDADIGRRERLLASIEKPVTREEDRAAMGARAPVTTMRSRAALVAAFVGLTACDPGFVLQGAVHDADGRPVEGAEVVLVYDGVDQGGARSDNRGHFQDRWIGAYGDECFIEVRVARMAPSRYPLMKNCTRRYHGNTCVEVTLNVRLSRPSGP